MFKKISSIGEQGIINIIRNKFKIDQKGVLDIGDDAALIPKNKKESYVITTDMLVEDIHFLKNKITPKELGYKSLAVNLSDIAAMGGKPLYSLVSICLPKNLKINWIKKFLDGYNSLSKEFNVYLIGGDTTGTLNRITINIMAIGEIKNKNIKLQSTAKIGDILCLTGEIGDSSAGLECLLKEKSKKTKLNKHLINRHHMPFPHCKEGRFLSKFKAITSMTDVSDGLYRDAMKIMRESRVGINIDLGALPISDELIKFCELSKLKTYDFSVFGGEDYCLLVTVNNKSFSKISKKFKRKFKRDLFPIGKVTAKHNGLKFFNKNFKTELNPINLFKHF